MSFPEQSGWLAFYEWDTQTTTRGLGLVELVLRTFLS